MHWHKCKFDTQQQQQQNYKYKWITYIYVICDEFFCCCCWCGWYSFMCVQHSTVSMLRVWIIWDGFREPGHRLTKLMRIALARARTHTTHTYVIMTSTWWNVVCHNCGECIVCCTYTQPVQFHDNIILSERQWMMNEGMMTSPRIRYDSTVNIARRTTDLSGLNMLVIYTRMHRFYVQKHNNNKQKICFRFIVLWYILRTARTTLTQSNESMCVVYVCLVFCWTSVFCLFVRHLNRQWWSYLAYATRIPHAYVLYTIHFTNMQIIIICLHNLKFSKCHTFYAAIFHRIVIFIQYTSTSIE